MSTSDLRFIGKLKYRSTNTESPYPVSDALKPFLGYLANHRSGVLIAESGRGRSYVSGCICAELAEKGQLGVIVSLESYVSPDVQSLISPANLSDLQQFNQIPLIILDGYEHLLNKGGSLQAIINSLHHYFAEKAIHILVTCLPIDFALHNPAGIFEGVGENTDRATLITELQSMDANEIEDYIAFEKDKIKAKHPWGNESARMYDGLLSWVEEQGLIDFCRKPKDLAWLLKLKVEHENHTEQFVSLEKVISRKVHFELSHARQFYGDNSYELAYENIELLAVASRLSAQPIPEVIFDYPFTLHGNRLLNIMRSGLIHSCHYGWGRWECAIAAPVGDWLIARFLRKKLTQGMPKHALNRHLKVKIGGKQQLHHLLAGGAVFLALDRDQRTFLKSVIKNWPEQVIDLGDPSLLSDEDRLQVLDCFRDKFRHDCPELGYNPIGIRRFTNQAVVEKVAISLESIVEAGTAFGEDQEYLVLLCFLIRYGRINRCADHLTCLLESDEVTDEHLWEAIASAVAKVGTQSQRGRLVAQIPQLDDHADKEQMEHYANRLYHINSHLILNEISLGQFISYLRPLIDVQTNESISGFKTYIPNTLWERLGTGSLKRELINGLYGFLRQEDGAINLRYRWIIDPLGDLLKHFLSESVITTEDQVWQIIVDLVSWKKSLSGGVASTSAFSYQIRDSSRIDIEMALRGMFQYEYILHLWIKYQFDRCGNTNKLWFFQLTQPIDRSIDHNKLAKEILLDNQEPDEFRLFALRGVDFRGLTSVNVADISSEIVRNAIQDKINAVFSAQENSQEPEDETDISHQQWVLEQQQAEEKDRQYVTDNLESIRSGENLRTLQVLANMGSNGRSDFGFFPAAEISEKFGEEAASAVQDGIIYLLEHYQLPCKTLSTDEIDGMYAALILQAITLESQLIQRFSGQRLRNAIAALTWELNNHPVWVDRLIRHHREIARNILEPVIQAETQLSGMDGTESSRSLHSFTRKSRGHLAYLCWDIIKQKLEYKKYQCIDAAVDATHLAIRYNSTNSACANIGNLASKNRDHHELQACWLAIEPESGLGYLEGLAEDRSESSRTSIIQILNTFSRYGRGDNSLIKLLWLSIDNLYQLLRILLTVLPANHNEMPEGFCTVTPEREIGDLYQNLVSSLTDRLSYEQGQALVTRLRADERFDDFWWVNHIEKSLFNKAISRRFPQEEVTHWIEGDWVESIRTSGQLHDYLVGVLQDIKVHLANDDFSSAPLWQGLFRYKNKIEENDRTEEEYVQVWLANEIQRRSKGHLTVERENQTNVSKRRDISISIPHVGRCVIEIKVVNKSRGYDTYKKLKDTINSQVPMYVTDYNYNAAILFLFKSDDKAYDLPARGKRRGLSELVDELTDALCELKRDNEQLRALEALSVFGISVEPRPLPKKTAAGVSATTNQPPSNAAFSASEP